MATSSRWETGNLFHLSSPVAGLGGYYKPRKFSVNLQNRHEITSQAPRYVNIPTFSYRSYRQPHDKKKRGSVTPLLDNYFVLALFTRKVIVALVYGILQVVIPVSKATIYDPHALGVKTCSDDLLGHNTSGLIIGSAVIYIYRQAFG